MSAKLCVTKGYTPLRLSENSTQPPLGGSEVDRLGVVSGRPFDVPPVEDPADHVELGRMGRLGVDQADADLLADPHGDRGAPGVRLQGPTETVTNLCPIFGHLSESGVTSGDREPRNHAVPAPPDPIRSVC